MKNFFHFFSKNVLGKWYSATNPSKKSFMLTKLLVFIVKIEGGFDRYKLEKSRIVPKNAGLPENSNSFEKNYSWICIEET